MSRCSWSRSTSRTSCHVITASDRSDPRIDYRNAVTNAQGTFEVLLPPGTWRVGPWVKLGESGLTTWASQVVRVTPGEKVQATFDARIATAKLRVLGPDGKAVVGVQLQMNRAGEPLDSHCAPTDDDGRTSVMTTPGMAVPIVLRRSLTDPASMQEFYRQNSGDPTMVQRMFVELPPILFAEQATPELEVRLPALHRRADVDCLPCFRRSTQA